MLTVCACASQSMSLYNQLQQAALQVALQFGGEGEEGGDDDFGSCLVVLPSEPVLAVLGYCYVERILTCIHLFHPAVLVAVQHWRRG